MRTNNFKVGQKFTSVKKICEFIGEKYIDSTDSRMAIIKRVEQYVRLEKKGRTYTVVEIYLEPKEKIDNRKGNSGGSNNQVYMQHIDPILINYFSGLEPSTKEQMKNNTKKVKIHTTINSLAETIGIINSNYRELIYDKMEFFYYLQDTENFSNITSMNNVFYSIGDITKSMITSSLARIEKLGLIKYKRNYILVENHEGEITTRLARIYEEITILECKEKALERFGIKNETELIGRDEDAKKYYNYLNSLIFKAIDGIERCYMGFEIVINCEMEIEVDNIQEHKEELNKVVRERVKDRNVKHKEKAEREKSEYDFGVNILPKYKEDMLKEDYLVDTDKVITYLLDLNSKKIKLIIEHKEDKSIEKRVEIDKSVPSDKEVVDIACTFEEVAEEKIVEEITKWDFNVSNVEYKEKEVWKFKPKYEWQREDFISSNYSDDELFSYSEETGKHIFL